MVRAMVRRHLHEQSQVRSPIAVCWSLVDLLVNSRLIVAENGDNAAVDVADAEYDATDPVTGNVFGVWSAVGTIIGTVSTTVLLDEAGELLILHPPQPPSSATPAGFSGILARSDTGGLWDIPGSWS